MQTFLFFNSTMSDKRAVSESSLNMKKTEKKIFTRQQCTVNLTDVSFNPTYQDPYWKASCFKLAFNFQLVSNLLFHFFLPSSQHMANFNNSNR